ncbi:hypothetical protein LR48_Vigan07g081700 [Vigna angularis]|uniref:Uncharacterized protein n=1 Tax=Phaseolus angularis TaxID=3914 RepID=A0A0L9UWH6_PHAAN|nr:hypothetical protein LR48_Vigan07g081700 [Vigna angularis]
MGGGGKTLILHLSQGHDYEKGVSIVVFDSSFGYRLCEWRRGRRLWLPWRDEDEGGSRVRILRFGLLISGLLNSSAKKMMKCDSAILVLFLGSYWFLAGFVGLWKRNFSDEEVVLVTFPTRIRNNWSDLPDRRRGVCDQPEEQRGVRDIMEGRMTVVEIKLEHVGLKQESMKLSIGGVETKVEAICKDLQELMRMMRERTHQLDGNSEGSQGSVSGKMNEEEGVRDGGPDDGGEGGPNGERGSGPSGAGCQEY